MTSLLMIGGDELQLKKRRPREERSLEERVKSLERDSWILAIALFIHVVLYGIRSIWFDGAAGNNITIYIINIFHELGDNIQYLII